MGYTPACGGMAAYAPSNIQTCLIEHGKFQIIIMEAPQENNVPVFIQKLKSCGVTDIVRTCEATYTQERFEMEGIRVHELTYPDGGAPPEEVITVWKNLIKSKYRPKDPKDYGVVAVHCAAGLGRAPLLAAIALIEMTGMDFMDAVEKIRDKQKGAINAKQLKYLQAYKRTTPAKKDACSMM